MKGSIVVVVIITFHFFYFSLRKCTIKHRTYHHHLLSRNETHTHKKYAKHWTNNPIQITSYIPTFREWDSIWTNPIFLVFLRYVEYTHKYEWLLDFTRFLDERTVFNRKRPKKYFHLLKLNVQKFDKTMPYRSYWNGIEKWLLWYVIVMLDHLKKGTNTYMPFSSLVLLLDLYNAFTTNFSKINVCI